MFNRLRAVPSKLKGLKNWSKTSGRLGAEDCWFGYQRQTDSCLEYYSLNY